MRSLFSFAVLLLVILAASAAAAEKQVFVNPDDPLYINSKYKFELALPPGQWGGQEQEDGCGVTFSDAADGDEEFTEVRAYVVPRNGMSFQLLFDEEAKGYMDVLHEDLSSEKDWFALTADSGRAYVYVKYFISGDLLNILCISSSKEQKATFDYAVPFISKKFRPGFGK
ncbi:MAG: hypothetical protein J6I40_08290 [Mailhella sp.]|nr:hypothetical protein [Mailhella sp.]